MTLIERAKNICLSPRTEWRVVAGEDTSPATLLRGYVLPLAGAAATAGFVRGSLVGESLPFVGTFRVPFTNGIEIAVFTVVMTVVGCFLMSWLIDALAPTFGARRNSQQAFKVAAYSFTPAWITGLLQVLPTPAILFILGALYGLYVLCLGLPPLMQCPRGKAIAYVSVVVISIIMVGVSLSALIPTPAIIPSKKPFGGLLGGGWW
jgi:hypothetical protein